MSEDRLSGETMRSLTGLTPAIASKKKESEVQKMSSFFASSSIPENKSIIYLCVCVCVGGRVCDRTKVRVCIFFY